MRRIGLVLGSALVASARPNPIRKVVTLLQEMQTEIEAEVKKEKTQMVKFECYCKKNNGALQKKVEEAQALIAKTNAEVESNVALKKQTTEELKKHKKDRADAEKNIAEAMKKREEEKQKSDAESTEQKKTLESLDRAIAALEKGMGKSFLQTSAASYLEQVMNSSTQIMSSIDVADQETLEAFLQAKSGFAPVGGEIVGILKMMKENFEESLAGVLKDEEEAVASFGKLKATLTDLIKSSGAAIEKKMELKGEVAVKIVEGKALASTTEKQMGDDAQTAAELKKACAGKGEEFKARQADASAEVDAIGQAIGVLNNDDALALFNKTDQRGPEEQAPANSFLETKSHLNVQATAAQFLSRKFQTPAIALLAASAKAQLSHKAGKVDFSKVTKMVDDMAKLLKAEAKSDLKSRDTCNASLEENEDKAKEGSNAISGLTTKVEEHEENIKQKAAVIEKQTASIAEAEQAMAEATEQRKGDNAEFVEVVALNKQAVELILKAKDKLNSFYSPQLVREEPAGAASEPVALAQQPETFSGPRKNKGQKGSSVQALMDTLANDLNKDTADLEHSEEVAQSDYERLSKDLTAQVAESRKAITDAQNSKAAAEDEKATASDDLAFQNEQLASTKQTIADLHAQCDFILGAFEERKSARENEIEGLQKAKAVLAGAKFD